MVLEHFFPEALVERWHSYAFFIGLLYGTIGIILAALLFPADPALAAVAFTAVLLVPAMRRLFAIEQEQQRREKRFSVRHLVHDHADFVTAYFLIFLGMFLVYSIASLVLPHFLVNEFFRSQMQVRGFASVTQLPFDVLFTQILANNAGVLALAFLLSLLAGDGAVILIAWNASIWGGIVGVTVQLAAAAKGVNPGVYLLVVVLALLPHLALEALAYITAATSGGLISKTLLLRKEHGSPLRPHTLIPYNAALLVIALGFLAVGAAVETFILPNLQLLGLV